MPKKLVLVFEADGSCQVEAMGFAGKGCKDATKPYEQALFDGELAVVHKPEIHRVEQKPTQGLGR